MSGLRLAQKSGAICALLLDNYTVELYQDSWLLDGTIKRTQVRMKYDRPVDYVPGGRNDTPKETEGNGLSYPQAVVVFEYLAEQQGMDAAVMAYLEGKPTDKAFDLPYPELFAQAKASFAERFPDPANQ